MWRRRRACFRLSGDGDVACLWSFCRKCEKRKREQDGSEVVAVIGVFRPFALHPMPFQVLFVHWFLSTLTSNER
jgi:hypothetical protein